MKISFTKMHGIGNDFMVIDATREPFLLNPQHIAKLSDRHTGVGFDQCLVIEKSALPEIDFLYRIFNADGQEVGQCGNGARCLARFVAARGLTTKHTLRIQTIKTVLQVSLHADQTVTVHFAPPQFTPSLIPIQASQQAIWYDLTLGTQTYHFHAIHVGNPHAILIVEDHLEQQDIANIGQKLSTHPFFPEQTNVGFVQIINKHHIRLRVYERGCGETHACGSGAVAAAAVCNLYHHLADTITVSLPGGDLQVYWPQHTGPIDLRGPANFVYEGTILEDH